MANYGGKSIEATPEQVTFPNDASKGYKTIETGKIYPEERKTTVQDYVGGEGSMGFNRNQGVTRDSNEFANPIILDMGQSKLQKLKENGSAAI